MHFRVQIHELKSEDRGPVPKYKVGCLRLHRMFASLHFQTVTFDKGNIFESESFSVSVGCIYASAGIIAGYDM